LHIFHCFFLQIFTALESEEENFFPDSEEESSIAESDYCPCCGNHSFLEQDSDTDTEGTDFDFVDLSKGNFEYFTKSVPLFLPMANSLDFLQHSPPGHSLYLGFSQGSSPNLITHCHV
jgi:hypothetical protein